MYVDVKYGKEKEKNNFKDPISDFDIGNKIKCSKLPLQRTRAYLFSDVTW